MNINIMLIILTTLVEVCAVVTLLFTQEIEVKIVILPVIFLWKEMYSVGKLLIKEAYKEFKEESI